MSNAMGHHSGNDYANLEPKVVGITAATGGLTMGIEMFV
ncbi:hypothetical protein GALL_306730 [mine drainage metagenome]|uniref:Uncharacterized protein n=1 Tax=mine drainage metagenome TaxID=410659 RepID=A0A1J5RCT0_9ZZZZ